MFTTQRANLLNAWQTHIHEASVLQLREDIQDAAPDHLLEEFFDLMAEQITVQQDYYQLHHIIFSCAINSFTPDAAGRLLIALKKTVLNRRKIVISAKELPDYIGPPAFVPDTPTSNPLPGLITGLAATPIGGEHFVVETTAMPGKGELMLTGHLGNVMKESAHAA